MPLHTAFHHIFDKVCANNCRVWDCWGARGWKWRKILDGFAPGNQAERELCSRLMTEVNAVSLSPGRDEVMWRWDNSGRFSVKSLYNFLKDGGVVDRRWTQLWTIPTPLKVKIFVWLLIRKKVLTADNLSKRGWSGEGRCALCTNEDETVDHLFMVCPFTKALLEALLPNKLVLRGCEMPLQLWEDACLTYGTYGRKQRGTIAIVWWATWLERNRRIFEDMRRTAGQLLGEIKELRHLWFEHCTS